MINFKALFLTAAVVATGFAAAPANANDLPFCTEMVNNEMPCVDNGRTYEYGAIDACYVDLGRSDNLDAQCATRIAQSQAKYSNQPTPAPAYTYIPSGIVRDAYTTGSECLSTQSHVSTNWNGTVNCY